ncbi:hypothetical protein GCM10010278_62910 [Streptomyces melanogenes]|nr:hypothetical protein GCM10010278_62910 [Streptomyces melanogenes]
MPTVVAARTTATAAVSRNRGVRARVRDMEGVSSEKEVRVVAEHVTPTKTLEENGRLYALCNEIFRNEVFVPRD